MDEGSLVGAAPSGTDVQSPPRRGCLGDPRSVQVGGTCGQPGVRAPTAAQPRLRGPELHRVTDIRCRPRHRGRGHRRELRAVHFCTVWPRLPLELCGGRGAASLLGLPQLQARRPWGAPRACALPGGPRMAARGLLVTAAGSAPSSLTPVVEGETAPIKLFKIALGRLRLSGRGRGRSHKAAAGVTKQRLFIMPEIRYSGFLGNKSAMYKTLQRCSRDPYKMIVSVVCSKAGAGRSPPPHPGWGHRAVTALPGCDVGVRAFRAQTPGALSPAQQASLGVSVPQTR